MNVLNFLHITKTWWLQILFHRHVCSYIARQGSCPRLTGLVSCVTLPQLSSVHCLQCKESIMLLNQAGFWFELWGFSAICTGAGVSQVRATLVCWPRARSFFFNLFESWTPPMRLSWELDGCWGPLLITAKIFSEDFFFFFFCLLEKLKYNVICASQVNLCK